MTSAAVGADCSIVAESLGKLFLDSTVIAFRQLSLAVRNQEILCIVGLSGCGKTTLLGCMLAVSPVAIAAASKCGKSGVWRTTAINKTGPGSAAHRSTSFRTAPRPGHERCQQELTT